MGSIKSFPRPGVKSKLATTSKSSTGLQNKTFYCETCDVHVNSETQLKQVRGTEQERERERERERETLKHSNTEELRGMEFVLKSTQLFCTHSMFN